MISPSFEAEEGKVISPEVTKFKFEINFLGNVKHC